MIKVFNSKNEYDNYTQGGLVAGDLYYVLADGSVHFRSNNIDGEDKVYDKGDGGSEPELNWEQATPNTSFYNAKMVDGLEIGKTYRIHITYTWQEGMYIGRPYFYFVCSNNNSWGVYSGIANSYSAGYQQIQIETDSEDFYFDITFPKFKDATGGDDYGIAIEQGGGAYPDASMEIALLSDNASEE
jgi:hypothetical protein